MASDAAQSREDNLDQAAPKKMGRPRVILPNKRQLEAFMANYPTAESTCLFFNIGTKALFRFIKAEYGLTYVQFREKFMVATRHILVQKALERALKKESDRMLELCLKNLAGWNGLATAAPEQTVIQLKYSLEAPKERDVTPGGKDESA